MMLLLGSDLMPDAPRILWSVRCHNHPYSAEDLASRSPWDRLRARSYFPAVSGKLLPETARENSRARACKTILARCRALRPVRVMTKQVIF
jgi:hypothetical protein